MQIEPHDDPKPLAGWRVLVPRGGTWGEAVATNLRALGAVPVVAPLINFAATTDQAALDSALAELTAGDFDWVTFTSAATVDVVQAYDIEIPDDTRIAAVGETTAAALAAAGYRVDLTPDDDNSAASLAEHLIAAEDAPRRILSLRSEAARPILSRRLADAGHDVRSVIAYRTVGVPASDRVLEDVRSGRINALLVTGGSVAQQVREQFTDIPAETVLAAIGAETHADARSAGLAVASERSDSVASLIAAVASLPLPHAADELSL